MVPPIADKTSENFAAESQILQEVKGLHSRPVFTLYFVKLTQLYNIHVYKACTMRYYTVQHNF